MQTPQEKQDALAKSIGIPELYFKREDLHAYGSHKGRSIPVMIDTYYASGDRNFVISSSGNAALAAALYIRELNSQKKEPANLDIFVGKRVAPHKLKKLENLADEHIRVLIKERPVQALTQAAQDGMRSLRQSMDDTALLGYASLCNELASIKNIGAIFIGTSSGTTAQALAMYFLKKAPGVQVHIVQTSSCHPITDEFDTSFDLPPEKSLADAITDITAYRKTKLVPLIRETGGRGWAVTNEHIETALTLTRKYSNLDISPNSALSIAGLIQAMYAGHDMEGAVVCMICGE